MGCRPGRERRGRDGPAGRSVFAGNHDGLVGDIEGERRKREIGEGDREVPKSRH